MLLFLGEVDDNSPSHDYPRAVMYVDPSFRHDEPAVLTSRQETVKFFLGETWFNDGIELQQRRERVVVSPVQNRVVVDICRDPLVSICIDQVVAVSDLLFVSWKCITLGLASSDPVYMLVKTISIC